MDIKKIHEYLSGALSEDEAKLFLKELKTDKALQVEVELQREMINHLSDSEGMSNALSVIENVHRDYVEKEAKPKNKIWLLGTITAVAASIALFIIVDSQRGNTSIDTIYESYYVPPPASFGTKGISAEDILAQAEISFNEKSYQAALDLLTEYEKQTEEDSGEVSFYIALSHMSLENSAEAIDEFTELSIRNTIFANDCKWYLALLLIKQNKIIDAKQLLRELSQSSYREKSKNLLEEINKI